MDCPKCGRLAVLSEGICLDVSKARPHATPDTFGRERVATPGFYAQIYHCTGCPWLAAGRDTDRGFEQNLDWVPLQFVLGFQAAMDAGDIERPPGC